MRRRSNTINADSYEEFLEMSYAQSPAVLNPFNLPESPYCCLPSYSDSYQEPLFFADSPDQLSSQLDKPFVLSPERTDKGCDDINLYYGTPTGMSCADDESMSLSTQADSWVSSEGNSLGRSYRGDMKAKTTLQCDDGKNGGLSKVMIIGITGTGRHTLINSLFGDEKDQKKEEPKLRNAMDLLVRSKEEQGRVQRFKFWIRDPNCQRFDPLVKVYYRSINYYVFLYKTTDIKSLECAEKAIQEVLAEVPKERFQGLLLGNNMDTQQNREVTWEHGENLRNKYGLYRFIEVSDLKNDVEKLDKELNEFLGILGSE